MAVHHDRVRFGAAYYYEYAGPGQDPTPETLERDLDLMQAAAFSVIRVGESIWATWEPDDGGSTWTGCSPSSTAPLARGIDVVIGTPTYAVPPWMVRRYPEVAGEDRTGSPSAGAPVRRWTSRTPPSASTPTGSARIVERYRDHPAVIGFQVDNEPGLDLLHNHGVFQPFVDDLRRTYGDVETLNREWGLVYWSHRLSSGRTCGPRTTTPSRSTTSPGGSSRHPDHRVDRLAGRDRPGDRRPRPVRHHLHRLRRPGLQDAELAAVSTSQRAIPTTAMQDGLAHPSRGRVPLDWTTERDLGDIPGRGPDVLQSRRAVPGDRDECRGDRWPDA